MYEISSDIKNKINERDQVILTYLFEGQINKMIRYDFDGTETVSEIKYRDTIDPDVFIYNKENNENHIIFNSCNIDFNDLEKLLNAKIFNVRLTVGKIKYEENTYSNPIKEVLNDQFLKYLNTDHESNYCLIEDPYLIKNDDKKHLNETIAKIKTINNKITYFLVLLSVNQNSEKIKSEKTEDKNGTIFFIPIKNASTNSNNLANRFHDRNILTFDFWINNGHSIESHYSYKYIQTQSFIIPRLTNKDRFDDKIKGSLLLIKQYCTDYDFRVKLPAKIENMSVLIHELVNYDV